MAKSVGGKGVSGKAPPRRPLDAQSAERGANIVRKLLALDTSNLDAVARFVTHVRKYPSDDELDGAAPNLTDAAFIIERVLDALRTGDELDWLNLRNAAELLSDSPRKALGERYAMAVALLESLAYDTLDPLAFDAFKANMARCAPEFRNLSRDFVNGVLDRMSEDRLKRIEASYAVALLALDVGAFGARRERKGGWLETEPQACRRISNRIRNAARKRV